MKQLNTFQLGDKYYKIAIYAIFALAVGMSLAQYLYNRSLFNDEAGVALNIIQENFCGLMKPLKGGYVAPVLWLWIEKLFSMLFTSSEYGLRLFQLLCFWISLFFFYKLAKQTLQNKIAIIVSFSLFAFFITFNKFSSDVKQYGTDVTVSTLIYWLTIKSYRSANRKWLTLSIAGAVAIFLSNVAPIILASVGLYVIYELRREEKRREEKRRGNRYLPVLIVFATWLAVFGVYYFLFIRTNTNEEMMLRFWSRANAFLTFSSFNKMAKFLYVGIIMNVFDLHLRTFNLFNTIVAVLFVCGTFRLIQQKKYLLLLFLYAPIIVHLLLSYLHLYPFVARLFLYWRPMFFLLCGYGVMIAIKQKYLKYLVLLLPIYALVLLIKAVPQRHSEFRESISYIITNSKRDDKIFVVPKSIHSFRYYSLRGLSTDNEVIIAKSWDGDQWRNHSALLDEVLESTGKVWLLIGYDQKGDDYIPLLLDGIEDKGCQRLDEFHTFGSSAYLYDFGE